MTWHRVAALDELAESSAKTVTAAMGAWAAAPDRLILSLSGACRTPS
jgi:hypothetical protein